jgi:hypothetical protein
MTVIGDRFFSTRAPAITKLFYADDVMLFCNAKMSEVRALRGIFSYALCLNQYCDWSGQSINMEKCGIFSSTGVHAQFLSQIKNLWGLKKLHQGASYLGVPLFLSKNRNKDFAYVKEKIEARTAG